MRRVFLYVAIKPGKGEVETMSSEIRYFLNQKRFSIQLTHQQEVRSASRQGWPQLYVQEKWCFCSLPSAGAVCCQCKCNTRCSSTCRCDGVQAALLPGQHRQQWDFPAHIHRALIKHEGNRGWQQQWHKECVAWEGLFYVTCASVTEQPEQSPPFTPTPAPGLCPVLPALLPTQPNGVSLLSTGTLAPVSALHSVWSPQRASCPGRGHLRAGHPRRVPAWPGASRHSLLAAAAPKDRGKGPLPILGTVTSAVAPAWGTAGGFLWGNHRCLVPAPASCRCMEDRKISCSSSKPPQRCSKPSCVFVVFKKHERQKQAAPVSQHLGAEK